MSFSPKLSRKLAVALDAAQHRNPSKGDELIAAREDIVRVDRLSGQSRIAQLSAATKRFLKL